MTYDLCLMLQRDTGGGQGQCRRRTWHSYIFRVKMESETDGATQSKWSLIETTTPVQNSRVTMCSYITSSTQLCHLLKYFNLEIAFWYYKKTGFFCLLVFIFICCLGFFPTQIYICAVGVFYISTFYIYIFLFMGNLTDDRFIHMKSSHCTCLMQNNNTYSGCSTEL